MTEDSTVTTGSTPQSLRWPPPAEIALPNGVEAAQLNFEVEVEDSGASMEAVERVIGTFRTAMNLGMFGERGFLEAKPRGRRTEGRVQQEWQVRGAQPGAYRVLLEMLEGVHRHELPLTALRLQSTAPLHGMLDLHAIIASPYPSRPQQIDFVVRLRHDIAEAKDPVIRLSFAHEIQDEGFRALSSMFRIWDDMVVSGGYGTDFGALEPEDVPIDRQTYIASRETVEHVLYWTIGSEEAFNALINAMTRITSLWPLLMFEVE